jgi:HPt (histidine-containing phosphotransfer) domain-containing protein
MVAIAANPSRSREYPAAERGFDGDDSEPAIDLVHLSRQTLSDQALEVELLDLFERQSARIIAQLRQPDAGDAKIRGDLAHMLRGSALAVGAGRVARSAQIYEASCAAPRGSAGAALDALAETVAEARAAIAQLLGR